MCIDKVSSYLHGDDRKRQSTRKPGKILPFNSHCISESQYSSPCGPSTRPTSRLYRCHLFAGIAPHQYSLSCRPRRKRAVDHGGSGPGRQRPGQRERRLEVAEGQGRWQDRSNWRSRCRSTIWCGIGFVIALNMTVKKTARTGGHGIHLADPAQAGDPHSGAAVLPGGRPRRRCA